MPTCPNHEPLVGLNTPAKFPERIRTAAQGSLSRALLEDRGSSLIEFAVVLPVMLMVMFGITTFGLTTNNYVLLTNGTSAGARQLAISRGVTVDPCATLTAAVVSAAPMLKSSSLSFYTVVNGVAATGTSCTSLVSSMLQGTNATVTVTYPCVLTVDGTNYAPSCKLQSQMTELIQ